MVIAREVEEGRRCMGAHPALWVMSHTGIDWVNTSRIEQNLTRCVLTHRLSILLGREPRLHDPVHPPQGVALRPDISLCRRLDLAEVDRPEQCAQRAACPGAPGTNTRQAMILESCDVLNREHDTRSDCVLTRCLRHRSSQLSRAPWRSPASRLPLGVLGVEATVPP
jgi:hypothetical protein